MYKEILVLVTMGCTIVGLSVKCPSRFAVVLNDDCSTLWRCVWGYPMKMHKCKKGLIYSRHLEVCVYKGSQLDDCKSACRSKPCKNGGKCTETKGGKSFYCKCHPTHTGRTCEKVIKTFNITEVCSRNKTLVVPHPTECHQYYNCSRPYKSVPRYFSQYKYECHYPEQFSATSLNCEDFDDVNCESRKERKSGCSYLSNRCPRSHCKPCSLAFPSCIGKYDGMHIHASKPKSPYFMVCRKQRTVKTGRCPTDRVTGKQLYVRNGRCSATVPPK